MAETGLAVVNKMTKREVNGSDKHSSFIRNDIFNKK
jgi:hypothetical protein